MITPSIILWSIFILLAAGTDVVFFTVVASKLVVNPAALLLSMFILLAAETGLLFLGVMLTSSFPSEDEDGIHQQGYAARSIWFLFVTLVMLASFIVTIPFLPYQPKVAAKSPVQKVPVIAQQFMFLMPSHFPVQQRILFEVTSRDVNHNFGVYDPDGDLIAQIQAMPNYVNNLEITFQKPGRYTIRCLEYCGTGHSHMEKDFTVGAY